MSIGRRTILLGGLAAGLAARAAAQTSLPPAQDARPLVHADPTEFIDLWPNGAPGAPSPLPAEALRERSTDAAFNDRILTNVARPRMAVFRPERPNGAAALIIPGGGYAWVVVDKEGYELARLLAARGITAFVLFYRLPHQGWAAGPNVALSDAQRAMRLIRRQDGLDPARVCAIGFSAGGHVCADLMTRFAAPAYDPIDAADCLSARPDAAAPIYPVVTMSAPHAHAGSRRNLVGENATAVLERAHSPHLNVPADAPPTFLLHAEDDNSVPIENSLMLREALRARGVATETHVFPDGGHGFGLRLARGKSVENWPDLFLGWGRYQGLWT
ncbi:MAG: alpha/beta hydrolase [Sphingosinicella sp.]|uniref:alpha/beta hydrolase n=1 Tax=Sphingosinicella sp. TaxID=1917971 RepID=UPI004037DE62